MQPAVEDDPQHEQSSGHDDGRYTNPDTPFALASTGDARLLSYCWLKAQAATGMPLARRQELPPEAFADLDALRAAHAASPSHIAAAVLPMVSISYCWLDKAHPDASGEQLRHIMDTLKELSLIHI